MIEDMRHIRAFLAVARIGNFTRAAAELHVSQSALTVQIRQLEESLGSALFDRGKRHIALTQAGKEVRAPLEKILVDTEAVISRTRELTSLRRGLVTMAVLPSLAAQMVPKVLERFTRLHPGIEVRIRDIVAERIVEAVRKEEVDFGIGSMLRPERELKSRLLRVDRLCAFVPAGHPLARQASVSFGELLTHSLILTGKDSSVRAIFEDGVKRLKIAPAMAYETNYMSTAIGLAKAGLGIAILPEAAAEIDKSAEIRCVAIRNPVLSRKIEIVERKDRSLSPSALKMVEILKQVACASG
jgi:LysR family transcriptional regulator, carnitine catabolism transcriptional activator